MLGAVQAALLACGAAAPPTTWDLTVQTTGSSQDYVVDINSGTTPNININWGDNGAVENFTSTGQKAHTYTNAGTYTVKISGSFASGGNIRLGSNSSNRSRLKGTKAVCNIVGLSNFSSTFYGCTGLTSLPTDLFRYNTAVSSSGFYRTFHGCTKLQLSPYIFFSAGEESTRFLNRVSNFQECFYLTSFSGSQGTAPALWNCDFGTGTPTKTDCFQGHSSSSLSNWANIPADWT